MKVVITGGAGFLGKKLARRILQQGAMAGPSGAAEQVSELLLFDVGMASGPGLDDPRVKTVAGDIQYQAADHRNHANGYRSLDQRHRDALQHGTADLAAQGPDQQQQGHHGKVLGEQDRETGAASGRHHAALPGKQFHHDRR